MDNEPEGLTPEQVKVINENARVQTAGLDEARTVAQQLGVPDPEVEQLDSKVNEVMAREPQPLNNLTALYDMTTFQGNTNSTPLEQSGEKD
jgi:hypothetical protein